MLANLTILAYDNIMKEMENLVKQFLYEEDFTLRNALAYAGLGLSKTTGMAGEIVNGVGFANQQYSEERQARMGEILGEMLFYWHVLVSTINTSPRDIVNQYLASWEATRVKLAQEAGITLQDMMEMKKHVKPEAMLKYAHEIEREEDWREKESERKKMLDGY